MATITSTESGATGRYIDCGAASALANIGNTSTGCTVIAYVKPAAQSVLGYIFAKGTSGGSGLRLGVNTALEVFFAPYGTSGDSISPNKFASGSLTAGNWYHIQATASGNGSLLASSLALYIDAGNDSTGQSANGSGSILSDTASSVFLLNRTGLGREFTGNIAYVAVWSRVLSSTERATVRSDGPLAVPDGLQFCFANGQDYSSNAIAVSARTTAVAGTLPPNTALGSPATDATAYGGIGTGIGSGTGGGASGITPGVADGGTGSGSGAGTGGDAVGSSITLSASFERSSVNLSASSVTGSGDSAVVAIMPKMQESEGVSSGTAWQEPSVDVTGVIGFRPTFRFLNWTDTQPGVSPNGTTTEWPSTRRPMYSYDDGATWSYFDTAVVRDATNKWIEFRNSTAFTQNKVRIGRSRQVSVHMVGEWLASMDAAHSFFNPSASALSYTPTGNVSSYAAQKFIADEFSAQTDSLSATISATPFYSAEINDTSLTPSGGGQKRTAILNGGVHASEDLANRVLMAAVEFLCGSSAEAQALRREYRILVTPMLNAPGRAGGGWRGSWTQGVSGWDDANRHYNTTGSLLEIINKPKAVHAADLAGAVPDFVIDYHATFAGQLGVYATAGDGWHSAFQSALQTYAGQTVTDDGDTVAGMFSYYWTYSVGAKLGVTLEVGDPSPMTDVQISNIGVGSIKAVKQMLDDGRFFVIASGGTGIGVGTGSGGDSTGQINAVSEGGTGTGTGSGTGGDAIGETLGSATATGGTGTGTGSGSGGAAEGQISAEAAGGTGTGSGSGTGGAATGGGITWPAESDVRLGVTYGPTGTEYTGAMTGGTGPTADQIAAAVLIALQGTTIPVNVTHFNGNPTQGSGAPGDPVRPA